MYSKLFESIIENESNSFDEDFKSFLKLLDDSVMIYLLSIGFFGTPDEYTLKITSVYEEFEISDLPYLEQQKLINLIVVLSGNEELLSYTYVEALNAYLDKSDVCYVVDLDSFDEDAVGKKVTELTVQDLERHSIEAYVDDNKGIIRDINLGNNFDSKFILGDLVSEEEKYFLVNIGDTPNPIIAYGNYEKLGNVLKGMGYTFVSVQYALKQLGDDYVLI